MSDFKIDKNIPVPSINSPRHNGLTAAFVGMEIGDSIFIDGGKRETVGARLNYAKLKCSHKFTLRTVDGGVRIWRIA